MAVIRVDALMRAAQIKAMDVDPLVDRHRGAPGIIQSRKVLRLSDPGAESPQETRTRLTLVAAGLPPPQTQIEVAGRRANPDGIAGIWLANLSLCATFQRILEHELRIAPHEAS